MRGLADTLPPNVTLYEQSPILEIAKGAPLTLKLRDGEVCADRLLLATNYEAVKLGFLRRRLAGSTLSGSFTHVLTDEEFSGLGDLSEWGGLSLHSGGATVRLTKDRRICLRNTAEYNGSASIERRLHGVFQIWSMCRSNSPGPV